jgi:hypothetical protein
MPEADGTNEVEVVKAREFDLTGFVKKAAAAIPIVTGAAVGILKAADVEITEGIWFAVFGLAAVVLLGASLVMAADMIARALATGLVAKAKAKADGTSAGPTPAGVEIVAMPPGTLAWLKDENKPKPVLAIAGDGEKSSAYLVAGGQPTKIPPGNEGPAAIDGAPTWHGADAIRAVKPAKWRP